MILPFNAFMKLNTPDVMITINVRSIDALPRDVFTLLSFAMTEMLVLVIVAILKQENASLLLWFVTLLINAQKLYAMLRLVVSSPQRNAMMESLVLSILATNTLVA
jgi:hypothetical protein